MLVKFDKNQKIKKSKNFLDEYLKEIYENNKFFEIYRILKYYENILNLHIWKKKYLKISKDVKPSNLLKKKTNVNIPSSYVYKKEKIFKFFKIILDFYDFSEKSCTNYIDIAKIKIISKFCNIILCTSKNNRFLGVLNFRIYKFLRTYYSIGEFLWKFQILI